MTRSPASADARRERRRIRVTGTVQGVGFRPFVYRVATQLGLVGWVSNDAAGVVIEAEGLADALDELARRVAADAPPLARVAAVSATPLPVRGDADFVIAVSDGAGTADVPVSVDVGPCADCLREVGDPTDRRHGYVFTNCTNCGPRYTIVRAVPYDRPATTMAPFVMCAACQAEYDDPADRRFHAQPNACPACGPRLAYEEPPGTPVAGDGLELTVAALLAGRIVAVKGVGGYHLAVDASDDAAVAELRRRKARDDKPFALLLPDVAAARAVVELADDAAAVLASPRRPIVLARRRPGAGIAPPVAPGLPELGVMLPPSPLHHLLAQRVGRPLVLTSGNRTDEPIAFTDDDARQRLAPLVDGLLRHDRAIHIRCDDSVVRADVAGGLQLIRRSRGYAPEPLRLPVPASRPLLAVGAELKATVAVAKGAHVIASHHLGDLEHLPAYAAFRQAVDHLAALFGVAPQLVAHDLHPEYLSTKFALELDLPAVAVQHHHAHIAACLAEHRFTGPVVGLAFDGLGYGTDGTLWGGEVLVADLAGFERAGHLRPVGLPGGAAAIREPWRMAVAWADAAGLDVERIGAALDDRWPVVRGLSVSAPPTSSVGRLFDAVAALLGVRGRVTYEGQAAVELEALARRAAIAAAPVYPVAVTGRVLDPAPLLHAVMADHERGVDLAVIAAGFHRGLASAAADLATEVAAAHHLDTVALSGGVFQNAVLSTLVADRLNAAGLRVLTHREVPANDGGIAIGQAAIAAAHPH